jgi:hypothetical protein
MQMDRREFLKSSDMEVMWRVLASYPQRKRKSPGLLESDQSEKTIKAIKRISGLGFMVSTTHEYDTVFIVDKFSQPPKYGCFNLTGKQLDSLVLLDRVRAINTLYYEDIAKHLKN